MDKISRFSIFCSISTAIDMKSTLYTAFPLPNPKWDFCCLSFTTVFIRGQRGDQTDDLLIEMYLGKFILCGNRPRPHTEMD